MTTIQQLLQTGAVKGNEIFAKLLDKSATAIRVRERLFADLKDELERQAAFEEQRLFPVLRKRDETKDLVAEALNNNQQMRKLLTELEQAPKNSEAFGAKVTELRDLFQRHLRDNNKDLVPAVVKALSDEEAGTAAGKSAAELAEITQARRADGAEHQPEAGPEAAAEARDSSHVVEAGIDAARQGAEVARVAQGVGANADRESHRAVQSTMAPNELRETARSAGTASVGLSMVTLLNEQAQHALQIQKVMADGRAQRLAEAAQVQGAFMAASFQRMGQFNDRYLAFVRSWRGFAFFPSTHR